MATSSTPFRRTGANSWEELLDQVNQEFQDPPENTDCDPIDTIPTPDECHRWAKSDIQEVHDKLNSMAHDCFTFQAIPDLWKVSIISDIEGQLSNSWCDCEEDEICCEPCPNAGSPSTQFLAHFEETGDCCTPIGPDCQTCASDFCFRDVCRPLDDGLNEYAQWGLLKAEFCVLEDEVNDLEEEIATLEAQLAACPAGPSGEACRTAKQAEIDAKNSELTAKEDEKSDKETEADDKQTEYRGLSDTFIACLTSCSTGPTCGTRPNELVVDGGFSSMFI